MVSFLSEFQLAICGAAKATLFLPVRNRASEIANLLVDLDKIRTERRKAKANRTKYTGIGNEFSGGSRFGGFGGDSFYDTSRYSGSSGGGNILFILSAFI